MNVIDVIGDIHGRFDKLEKLMTALGYRRQGATFVPPRGHEALFLGDLIDPKPGHALPGGVRATLRAVKAMCDLGHGRCLMGNHEFNAVCYHTRDGEDWLRKHDARNLNAHQGTLDDFPDHQQPDGEWLREWIPWFKTLPFFLDLGSLRAVHACWHPGHLERLAAASLEDPEFLRAAAVPETPEGEAIETVLKGIELPLPEGHGFLDHTGTRRSRFRARWWIAPEPGARCRDLVFPASDEIPLAPLGAEAGPMLPAYPADAPPLFFGHYFKPDTSPLFPELPNLACLDHSAAKDGPLVAYRWRGEGRLRADHLVAQR